MSASHGETPPDHQYLPLEGVSGVSSIHYCSVLTGLFTSLINLRFPSVQVSCLNKCRHFSLRPQTEEAKEEELMLNSILEEACKVTTGKGVFRDEALPMICTGVPLHLPSKQ